MVRLSIWSSLLLAASLVALPSIANPIPIDDTLSPDAHLLLPRKSSGGHSSGGRSSKSSKTSSAKSSTGSSSSSTKGGGSTYAGSGSKSSWNPGATSSGAGFYPPRGYRPYYTGGGGNSGARTGFAAGALIGAGGVSHGYHGARHTVNDSVNVFENVSFADVVQIGTHRSFATFDVAHPTSDVSDQDQFKSIDQQLDDGIRLLHLEGRPFGQASNDSASGLSLCVANCTVRSWGSLEASLQRIAQWLDGNPIDVLTLLLSNPDKVDVGRWDAAFQQTRLAQRAFKPAIPSLSHSQWPTYGDLIGNNTRLVVLLDQGADATRHAYLLDLDSNVWQNAQQQTTVPFDCSVARGTPAAGKLGLLYHTKYRSDGEGLERDDGSVATVNSADGASGVVSGYRNCTAAHSYDERPTFVLVNNYHEPSQRGAVFGGAVINNISDASESDPANGSGRAAGAAGSTLLVTAVGMAAAMVLVGGGGAMAL
ncbi:hypothetical protein ACQY0O_006023 [Thecaphora frezii]